jgi:hypothetical protein
MKRIARRLLLVVTALMGAVVVATCVGRIPPDDPAPDASGVTIRVENHDYYEADVWLLNGEAQVQKLGTVMANSKHTFVINEHLIMGQQIALYARERFDGTTYKTDPFGVVPGMGFIWRIGYVRGQGALFPLFAER